MKLLVVLALRGIRSRVKHLKAFLYSGAINAQELVLRGGHIDKVRLALGAFLIEKLVHRLICWGFSQVGADDLVQRFPQARRAALGPHIIAEIGDVRRFYSKKALVAYAGLDAPPNDSGNITGRHKSMSKIGASSLRRTLFLVMSAYLTKLSRS